MKILFLCSSHFDYVQDMTYAGLVKLVGQKNIKVAPFNRSFYFKSKIYPKNLGYVGNPLSYFTNQFNFDYDLVIVASCKIPPFEKLLKLKLKDVPVIFLDGGDRPEIGGDLIRYGREDLLKEVFGKIKFNLIFKREILEDQVVASNVHPLPIAINLDRTKHIQVSEKKYDVSFWAVESHPIRTQVLSMLENKYDCRANGTTLKQKFDTYKRKGDFYLEELKRCKIVLNFRGGGWDTLRYWEVPALSTFMISGVPRFKIPNPFTDGENIVYCQDDLSDLFEKIDFYLSHDKERDEIAKKSFEHLSRYHTDEARARYILELVKTL